jgi:molybdopterin-biosynthesis enzyme MoeA-like protein
MAEMTGTEQLPERVDRIEHKLDALTASVDRRFDEVSEHFVEQREYTEFAFDRLRKEMLEGFNRLESKLDTNVERLERKLDTNVERLERKLDTSVERLEGKLDSSVKGLESKLDENVKRLEGTIASLGRKLDRFMKDQAGPPRRRRVRRAPKKR